MKVVDKSKLFGDEQLFLARQECAIQSMFTDSEYITRILAYTETQDEIISIMECVSDANWLEKKIDERKREIKNEHKLRQIARDILSGLKTLHDADFIHADIKIQNILATRPTKEMKAQGHTTRVKLCDFGISLHMAPDLFVDKKKAVMKERSGTIGYLAPEVQGKNIIVGPEIDVWSFGIVLYELCVAYKPT